LDAPVPQAATKIYCNAVASGYCASSTACIDARRGVVTDAPAMVLFRGGYVVGETLDQQGQRVAARVRIVGRASPAASSPVLEGVPPGYPAGFVSSEAGGGFTIGPIAPGEFEVWATVPGVGACSSVVRVSEGATTSVILTVNLTVHLSGRVIDAVGGAAAGVHVICRRESEGLPEESRQDAGALSEPPSDSAHIRGLAGRTRSE